MLPLLINLLLRLRPLRRTLHLSNNRLNLDLRQGRGEPRVERELVVGADISAFGVLGEDAEFATGEGLEAAAEVGFGDGGGGFDFL